MGDAGRLRADTSSGQVRHSCAPSESIGYGPLVGSRFVAAVSFVAATFGKVADYPERDGLVWKDDADIIGKGFMVIVRMSGGDPQDIHICVLRQHCNQRDRAKLYALLRYAAEHDIHVEDEPFSDVSRGRSAFT